MLTILGFTKHDLKLCLKHWWFLFVLSISNTDQTSSEDATASDPSQGKYTVMFGTATWPELAHKVTRVNLTVAFIPSSTFAPWT